jgi:hypothetical protein
MNKLDEFSSQTGYDQLILEDRLELDLPDDLELFTDDISHGTKYDENMTDILAYGRSGDPFGGKYRFRGERGELQSDNDDVAQNRPERAAIQEEVASIARREAINEVDAKLINVEYIQSTAIPSFVETKIEQFFDRREDRLERAIQAPSNNESREELLSERETVTREINKRIVAPLLLAFSLLMLVGAIGAGLNGSILIALVFLPMPITTGWLFWKVRNVWL